MLHSYLLILPPERMNLLLDVAQASQLVYSVAEKRVDDEGEQEFVVINNGTGSQVIIISENQEVKLQNIKFLRNSIALFFHNL